METPILDEWARERQLSFSILARHPFLGGSPSTNLAFIEKPLSRIPLFSHPTAGHRFIKTLCSKGLPTIYLSSNLARGLRVQR